VSTVRLEIEARSPGASTERLLADVFLGPLAQHVALAHVVEDEARESRGLLDVEAYSPELFATTFTAAPITWSVGQLARGPGAAKIKVWCAIRAGFPVRGSPVVAPYLRFVVPDGERIDRLLPIATLEVSERNLVLEFGAGGAPFVVPRSVDDGGVIDQAWASSAAVSRAWLDRGVIALAKLPGVGVRLIAPW